MLASLALGSVACVPRYRPPSAEEPHAIVKVRRNYERLAGVSLRETVDIDGHRAYQQVSPAAVGGAPRIDAVLVHPTLATTRISAGFFHTEMRQVHKSYTERVPHYTTETYDCSTGFGTNRVSRTCTRPKTEYRTETKYRWVTEEVEVSDGGCSAAVALAPAVGRVYLVQYTYRDHGVCQASCFEQVPLADGRFQDRPCPVPPPGEG
jgi:hypothetical protein